MIRLLKSALASSFLALGILATTSPASAAFTVTLEGVSPGVDSSGHLAGQSNLNSATTVSGVVYTPFGNGSLSSNHFVAFCIQTSQTITVGQTYTYSVVPLELAPDGAIMTGGQADQIRRLWTAERANINGDDERSAAFQWAIWQILGQETYNGSNGSIQSLITQYIGESNGDFALANLAALTNSTDQDMIIELETGSVVQVDVVPTPVPAGAIIALTGIVPCLALRRLLVGKKSVL